MGRSFQVALPSNAGGVEFPHNTTSSFKIRLPKPLEFGGEKWEVGLASISLSNSSNCLTETPPLLCG